MSEFLMIRLIVDEIYNEEFKEMSDDEFLKLSECELEDLILPHLNYIELMDNVKVLLRMKCKRTCWYCKHYDELNGFAYCNLENDAIETFDCNICSEFDRDECWTNYKEE